MIQRKIKTVGDFREAVREVAKVSNPNIPDKTALTGRQLYMQFCFRMAKFDDEFRTLDPIMASTWINMGVVRLIGEMIKRMYKDVDDIGIMRFFDGYVEENRYDTYAISTDEGEYVAEVEPGQIYSTDTLMIYGRLSYRRFYTAPQTGDDTDFPKYIPYEDGHLPIFPFETYRDGEEFKMDYRELERSEERSFNFSTSNSFSSMGMYPPKVYVSWATGRKLYIYVGTQKIMQGRASADPRQEPGVLARGARWIITKVVHNAFLIEKIYADNKIDTAGNDIITTIPLEYHQDIVDYAIDAFFESQYLQSFGKYSLKQAKQDADTLANISGNRQNKLDSIPPRRYQLEQAPGGGGQGGPTS